MLRYALRRLLWAIPTLVATSLVLFFVSTLAAEPPGSRRHDAAGEPVRTWAFEEARRERFLDLPRFFNTEPQDVRSRARAALKDVADGAPDEKAAAEELCRLGGAAFPYVLPLLEALPPSERGRVAVELAPVAERMGVGTVEELAKPGVAVVFWTHFWENRALDFTRSGVERAVLRLVEHGSDLREHDLAGVDTFALPEVMRALSASEDPVALARLTRLAHHATQRGPVLAADATPDEARRTVADWREWWFVHGADFVELDGLVRATAFIADTRYGKWLERARSGELGVSVVDGEPIAHKLRARAPVTLLLCLSAMLVSMAIAVPLGVFAAWRQGGPFDVTSSAVLFFLYATPTFVVAEVFRHFLPEQAGAGGRLALGVAALACGSLATFARWQRGAMLEVTRQDFVRTAKAKGVSGYRLAVVHGLRSALQPTIVLAGLYLPVVVGGAFVVEDVLELPGVGFETVRAVQAHDAPWLMAVLLASAVAVTLGLVASDVAASAADPRVRELLLERESGRSS